jgi:hypothetical protein
VPRRLIELDGATWSVTMGGSSTQYNKDEFPIVFSRVGGVHQERVARYSPLGSKRREDSLAELTDDEIRDLFRRSQPSWTTAQTGYRR